MSMLEPNKNGRYVYKDYLTWHDDQRWELIDGKPHMMVPAPSRKHQDISRELHIALHDAFADRDCKVYAAPFDVRLDGEVHNDEAQNIVQPDLSVICDQTKLDEKGCKGAPDLIVEILSNASIKRDKKDKYKLYASYGVREYWIVDPHFHSIEIHQLKDDFYTIHDVYTTNEEVEEKENEEVIKSAVFKEIHIPIQHIFST